MNLSRDGAGKHKISEMLSQNTYNTTTIQQHNHDATNTDLAGQINMLGGREDSGLGGPVLPSTCKCWHTLSCWWLNKEPQGGLGWAAGETDTESALPG